MRQAAITRKTGETDIRVSIGFGDSVDIKVQTGIGFFDHMLHLFAFHGGFDLDIECKGDLHVDAHHSVEDVGIALGQAISQALGDKAGIRRYGNAIIPMDEALANVTLDISGRPYLVLNMPEIAATIGQWDTELLREFMYALSIHAGITLHINVPYGQNAHHVVEAVFKALGRALKMAVSMDPDVKGVPSTKNVL